MILEDLHTHTCYCDGKDTPEAMVKAAIDKGLRTIGFSGHVYLTHGKYSMTPEKTLLYKREIAELKVKYGHKIRILCGIEADLYTLEDVTDYDYVIGSVHDIKVGDEFITVDHTAEIWKDGVERLLNGDHYKAAEMYFDAVVKCIERFKPDIIGHFDLVTKFIEQDCFMDITHPRYVTAYKKAVDALIPYDIPFEINTGAISRGYRTTPYPHKDILGYIAEKGGKVIFTGDTHAKENLCYMHEEFEQIAYDNGFENICTSEDIVPK